MSDGFWEIVSPEEGENIVANPSFELATTGYTAAFGSIARGAVSRRGRYGLSITPSGAGAGDVYTEVELNDAFTYTFSLDVKGTAGITVRVFFTDTSNNLLGSAVSVVATGVWQRIEVTYTAVATTTHRLHLDKTGSNTDLFHSDGWQCEANEYSTTYMDGEQDGCEWTGQPHLSASTRDRMSRDGGRPILLSDVGIYVREEPGAGMPPVQLQMTGSGAEDGSQYQGSKIMPRNLTLGLSFDGETRTGRHALRRQLLDLVNPHAVSPQQTFIVRYLGNNGVIRWAKFAYEAGGEMQPSDLLHVEYPAVRLVSDVPFWYSDGENSQVLTGNETKTYRLVASKVAGTWSNMGPPASSGSPTYTIIHSIAIDQNGTKVYFGGDFLNFNGDASADNIVAWDRKTLAWSNIGVANDVVWGLAVDASGNLYAVGEFTTIGGVAANRVAMWNGTIWAALGTGLNGNGYAVAIGADNNIYVGGAFTTAGGVTVNRIAAWNRATTTWLALGGTPGVNGDVLSLAVGGEGNIYVGGAFTTAGGAAAVRIAYWAATAKTPAWFPMGDGVDGNVNAISPRPNGDVYVGGAFTTADGNAISGIARWNGQTFLPLGLGINALPSVTGMAFTADGLLYVVGLFTEAGDLVNIGRIARWNGSRWQQIDADLPFISGPGAIAAIDNDIYIGLDDVGDGTSGPATTVTHEGSDYAWPRLYLKRTGGTSLRIRTITNETTGQKLLLSYDLLDGEELIIDLRPRRRMMHSSQFGTRWKLQPDSDVDEFYLVKGANVISMYVLSVGSPTLTAHAVWSDTFTSVD